MSHKFSSHPQKGEDIHSQATQYSLKHATLPTTKGGEPCTHLWILFPCAGQQGRIVDDQVNGVLHHQGL